MLISLNNKFWFFGFFSNFAVTSIDIKAGTYEGARCRRTLPEQLKYVCLGLTMLDLGTMIACFSVKKKYVLDTFTGFDEFEILKVMV